MKHLNLIRSVAWRFHRATDLEYEELFGEASVAYCNAIKRFDPSKGYKESTYLYFCMRNELINFCKKETRIKSRTQSIDGMDFAQEPRENLMDLIEEWPKDCQAIAKLVLDEAEYIVGHTPNFKRTEGEYTTPKQRLTATLRDQGWKVTRIQSTMKDVKELLATL